MSTEANIAEGVAKRGSAEFRRYLDISLGSHSELACLLRLARDLGYLDAEESTALEEVRAKAGQVTWRLYQRVARAAAKR